MFLLKLVASVAILAGVGFGFEASAGVAPFSTIWSVLATAIPVPPELLLLGIALTGICFLGRKRRKKAEPSIIDH